MIVLADENSLWGADVYIEATKDVPGANMTTISGTFISKVFEGPFRNMRKWVEEMNALRHGQGQDRAANVLLRYDMPQVREEIRKELRRHSCADLTSWESELTFWTSPSSRAAARNAT